MASIYRDYDKEIMSQADYERLQGFKNDYANATDDAGRKKANENAEALRGQYGYKRGGSGSDFSLLNPMQGVSQETNINLLKYQNQANNPTGQSDFYKQWTNQINAYMNRDPFSYDMASDALYQQYADQHTRLGNQAMQDTLGQAAALTGGYNSSYSQGAGQQTYQRYLEQLNNLVPELYGQARDTYYREGQDMLNAAELAAQGYNQETADYWNNLNYWAQQAGNEQNQYWQQKGFDQSEYWNQRDYEQQQAAFAAEQKQAAYGNLVTAISNTGYQPTDAELAAAGMTREEANKWANYYAMQQAQVFSSGSGGGGGGGRRSSGGSYGKSSSTASATAENGTKSNGITNTTSKGYSISQIAQGAHNRFGSSITLDSRTLDNYLSSLNLTAQELAQVKTTLLNSYGWKYSNRT